MTSILRIRMIRSFMISLAGNPIAIAAKISMSDLTPRIASEVDQAILKRMLKTRRAQRITTCLIHRKLHGACQAALRGRGKVVQEAKHSIDATRNKNRVVGARENPTTN